jgi:hypothetical protein
VDSRREGRRLYNWEELRLLNYAKKTTAVLKHVEGSDFGDSQLAAVVAAATSSGAHALAN